MQISPAARLFAICAATALITISVTTVVIVRAKPFDKLALTQNEWLAVRTAQVQVMQATNALAQSKEWQAQQSAQAELNKTVSTILNTRKLDPTQYVLCDGPVPGQPACDGLTAGQLALRELKKPTTPAAK